MGVFNVPSNVAVTSGKVGYAARWRQYNGGYLIRYVSSSWKDKNPPPPPATSAPEGYLAWNTSNAGPGFASGSGAWSGNFWSSISTTLRAWAAGNSALFSSTPETGSYTVTVSAATSLVNMDFRSNGYTISGAGPLNFATGGGIVTVDASKSATIDAVIGGSVGLTKRGTGTLTLGGTAGRNTYTGTTTISAGSVNASKDSALSVGDVTVTAANTMLTLSGGITLPNAITIGNSSLTSGGGNNTITGGVTLGGATASTITVSGTGLTIGGVVGGSGLTKAGTGTLTLLGANTYTGATTVSGGTLQIGNGTAGTAGSLASSGISLGANAVVFNRAAASAYAGNISGSGTVTKRGSGELRLSGTNTGAATGGHTGTTAIEGGKVVVTSASNIGTGTITVASACTLTLNTATATTAVPFARNMTGAGAFVKTGDGAFNFGPVSGTGAINRSLAIARVVVDGGALEMPVANALDTLRMNALRLGSGGAIDLAVNRTYKATRIKVAAGGADIKSGTLNITSSIVVADTGEYNIISGVPESDTGFYRINAANASCCEVTQRIGLVDNNRTVVLRIKEKSADEKLIYNYLEVDTAIAGATEGSVTVRLKGLNALRGFLVAGTNPRVTSVRIFYKPGRAAAEAADTAPGGGTFTISTASLQAIATDTHSVTFNVNRPVEDLIYYFNVSLSWMVNNVPRVDPSSTNTGYGYAYLRDPKSVVKENRLKIVENESARHNESDGLTFSLTISGLSNADFTPSATYAPYRPSVDQVGVWFKRGGPLPSETLITGPGIQLGRYDSLITFPLASGSGDTRQISFSTKAVENPTDTIHFAVAPHWTLGAKVDSVARPLASITFTVPKPGRTDVPNNTCLLTAEQPDKRQPVVMVKLSKNGALNEHASDILVQFALDAMMTDVIESFHVSPTDLNARDIERQLTANDAFAGAEREVHYMITVFDATGYGIPKTGSFAVGRRAPAPLTGFTAEAMGGGAMKLSWSPVSGLDTATLTKSKVYIVHSTGPLTLEPDDILRFSRIDSAAAGETSKEISGLTPGTDYWFYAVVYDVANPSKPTMNILSPVAVCNGNTGRDTRLTNLARVARFDFSESGENFTFEFALTKTLDSDERELSYTYYITRGADTVLAPKTNKFSAHTVTTQDSIFATFATEKLGSALVFGATYTLYVFTVNAAGNSSARDQRIKVLDLFGRQTIEITVGDSGSVNNGAFKLAAVGWSSKTGVCTTTVYRSDESISTNGFIPIGEHGYMYEVAVAGGLNATHGAFTISMAVDASSIPSQYTTGDVRMYRWTETRRYWEVVYSSKYERGYITGTAVDSIFKPGENGSTYRLMISETLPLVASLTDHTSPVAATDPIRGSFRVSTVVGNAKIEVMYALAEGATRLDTVKRSDDTTGGLYKNVNFEINETFVFNAQDCGVLVYVVVNDGHNTVPFNFSRRVKSNRYGGFQVKSQTRKWLPFATQVELNQNPRQAVRNALSVYFEGEDEGSFQIYDTLFRLFRWYETSDNRSDNSKWVEYKPGNDDIFAMEPGRLMWFKTSNFRSLNFGEATTVSLTSPFSITLPPKQWTDLVLPFRFKVRLGDILDSTVVTDSLEFYRWEDNGKQYSTKALKLMVADSSLELNGADDPFTIYNSSNSAVTLRVPPIPAFMSRYNKANAQKKGMAKAAAQETSDVWYYALRTRTGNAPELPEVQIGYSERERAFAVPPSFGSEAVVIIDEATGKEMGHHFSPALASGRTYKLRFYNDDKRKTTFTFSARPSDNAPLSAQITYVRAATGDILGNRSSAEQSITVAAMSYEDVLMIIGSNGYRTKAIVATPAGAKFWVNNIAVNRGAGSARINYYVPSVGVDRVDVSIYDVKGRLVWKNSQKAKAAAMNTMEWNSRIGGASARMYIVRVKAVGVNGKAVAVENKRITFVR